MEVHRRLVGDPLRLLRHAGARLSHRRSFVCLSADARHRAADRERARRRISARMAAASGHDRHRADLRRHREHRLRAARASSARRCRLGDRERRHHRGLHGRRRHRCSRIGKCNELRHVAAVPRRDAVPRVDRVAAPRGCGHLRPAPLAAQSRGRRVQPRRLCDRVVGDDARASCRRRRAARDLRDIRRADRRPVAQGRLLIRLTGAASVVAGVAALKL